MNLIIFSYFELDFCRLDSSKNQVQNRPKIKFNKLNFSNLIFQNQAQIDRGIKVHTMNLTIIFLFFEIYNVNYSCKPLVPLVGQKTPPLHEILTHLVITSLKKLEAQNMF